MRFSVLGSGSAGNAIAVEGGGVLVLIDAGFSGVEVLRRMDRVGFDGERLSAVFLTHEHSDHVRGAGVLARRLKIPVFATEDTLSACPAVFRGKEDLRFVDPGRAINLGGLSLEPFRVVHDAAAPVSLAVTEGASGDRLGLATDLGQSTAHARFALKGCHGLVIEANHDPDLLWSSRYPLAVKNRIASNRGHLSNEDAARLAGGLMHPDLQVVVLAHLSEETNSPDRARRVVDAELRRLGYRGRIVVASQSVPTGVVDLTGRAERAPREAQRSLFG